MLNISHFNLTQIFSRLYNWLGSFWTNIYYDKQFIQDLQSGRTLQYNQLYLDILENLKLEDRKNAPIIHRERWYPLIVKESEKNTGNLSKIKAGMPKAVIGEQTDEVYPDVTFKIGSNAEFTDLETYPVHGEFTDVVTCIVDNILKPNHILRKGVDFVVGENAIAIHKSYSPFTSNSFPAFETQEGNDREAVFWGCDTLIDKDYLNRHLGYIVNTDVPTSQAGKDIINSYWDSINYTNFGNFNQLLGVLCEVPVVKEDVEIIETVLEQAVITDKNVYRFKYTPEYRTKIVPGNPVYKGEFLDTAIVVFPYMTNFKNMETSFEFYSQLQELLPYFYLSKDILDSRYDKGFSVGWELMNVEDFSNKYNVPIDICNKVAEDGKICPIKFYFENVIGANTQVVSIDTARIGKEFLHESRFFGLVKNIIPSYIRLVVVDRLKVEEEIACPSEHEDVFAWIGAFDTFTGVSENIRYRWIPVCR